MNVFWWYFYSEKPPHLIGGLASLVSPLLTDIFLT